MRILFLDDNDERHKKFRYRTIGCVVDFAFDADSCIALLDVNEYDLVFLDHDLGGPESEGVLLEGVKDGRYVADWIADRASRFRSTCFIVHSLNPGGSDMMNVTLLGAGLVSHRKPFAWSLVVIEGNSVSFDGDFHQMENAKVRKIRPKK